MTHQRHCYWSMFPYTFHSPATNQRWALLCRDCLKNTVVKVIFVVLMSVELLKLLATHWWPIAVMFQYKYLEFTGIAMEKKLNKFQLFFHVCGGSPVGHWQLRWNVSIKEFNVARELPVSCQWVAGTRKFYDAAKLKISAFLHHASQE